MSFIDLFLVLPFRILIKTDLEFTSGTDSTDAIVIEMASVALFIIITTTKCYFKILKLYQFLKTNLFNIIIFIENKVFIYFYYLIII